MEQNDMDLIWWTAYFKGNRRKGLSRLRLALDDPTLYGRLKGSFEAMSVVIGTSDAGSADMMSVIYDSGKGDDLADAYAASTEYGSLEGLISGASASVVGNVMQMSDDLFAAALGNEEVLNGLVSDEAWVNGLLENERMLNSVMANSSACQALYKNEVTREALCSTPAGLGKMMAGCLGLDPSLYADGTEILADSSTIAGVAASPAVLNMIGSDADLREAFMANGRVTGHSAAILASLKDTEFFTEARASASASTGMEADRYCNGANPEIVSTKLQPDACWVSVTYADCYGASNYGWVARDLSDTYGDSGIYSSSTHYMFPGGVHFFSGSFNYAVYKPL